MGLAIINPNTSYALHRTAQNVIPRDPSKRKYLTSVSNFTYEYAGNGIYRLASLNIGNATQPYTYSVVLLVGQSGVSVDSISGVVTVSSDFTGGNVRIQINALYDNVYYTVAGSGLSDPFTASTIITNVQTPEEEIVTPYNNLIINTFSYSNNTITANGGTSTTPTISYQYDKAGTQMTSGGSITYKMHAISDSGATVNSNGVVTIPANSVQNTKTFVVEAKVVVDDTYQTEVAKIVQAAASSGTVTYTYSIEEINFSYDNNPVPATGNSNGLTPTLGYTLYKNGSDGSHNISNETVTISYSAAETLPTGVSLNSVTGTVTFAANDTDDLVTVRIRATLTGPDGSTANPTASINQQSRTLTEITFNTYNGNSTVALQVGDTMYASRVSLTRSYDTGGTSVLNAGQGNITLAIGATGTQSTSLTFSNPGTYSIYIYYGGLRTQVTATVSTLTKAYIKGIAEDPYPTSNAIASNDGSKVSIPLFVNVMSTEGAIEEMSFADYLTIQNRETYDPPVLTFRNAFYDYSIPEKYNEVGSDGTLHYDLTKANYVYDKTRISSITLTCTSNSSVDRSHTYNDVSIDMMSVYSSYFTNSNNFTSSVLISKPVISDSTTPTVAEGVTVLGGSGSNVGVHLSNTDTSLTNGLALSSSGYYYKLPQQESYLLSVVGSSSYVAVISTDADTLSGGTTYKVSTWGNNIKVSESSSSIPKYIRHTPDANTNTFIVDLGNSYPLTWQLLTPKTNE